MVIPDGLSFDELNKLYREEHAGDMRSMPFDEFFGEMDISATQKDNRVKTAKRIQEFMQLGIASMYYLRQEGLYDYTEPAMEMTEAYNSLLRELAIPLTAYFGMAHVANTVADIVSATSNHPDEMYYFTEDRATLIAENEANSIWNDSEYADADLTGKHWKTWHAIRDRRTRDTHRAVDGTTVPIDEYFIVGDALLMYPRADCDYPEEVVNCRCSLTFS